MHRLTLVLVSIAAFVLVCSAQQNRGYYRFPAIHADAIVFTSEGDLWEVGVEGGVARRLTTHLGEETNAAFSPDGKTIAFAASYEGPREVYTMPAAGGLPQRVTFDTSRYCAEPDWSRADPDKVAFTMKVGDSYQIGVLDLSTRLGEAVSKAPFDGIEPSWLPDGRHLVYTARTATANRVCILDTETGRSTAVSPASFGPALQASVWSR